MPAALDQVEIRAERVRGGARNVGGNRIGVAVQHRCGKVQGSKRGSQKPWTNALMPPPAVPPPRDQATIAAAVILLAVTGAVAAWLPARRATRLNPLESLRTD